MNANPLWVSRSGTNGLPIVAGAAVGAAALVGTIAVRSETAAIVGAAAGLTVVGGMPLLLAAARRRVLISAVELPIALLLLSTMVFRIRDAQTLARNPLDGAGMFRVACVGAALLLALAALSRRRNAAPVPVPAPVRIFGWYLLVVIAGAIVSSSPRLTLYRAAEVAVLLLTLTGALRAAGPAVAQRVSSVVRGFIVVMLACAWAGLLIAPGAALEQVGGRSGIAALPVRLVGVVPVMAANLVGTFGALLCLWSIGRLLDDDRRGPARHASIAGSFFGAGSVVAAQYRTGYVAVVAGVLLLLLLKRKLRPALVLVGAIAVATWFGLLPLDEVGSFVLRGQSEETVAALSGRAVWWEAALDEWSESPLVGRGLLTASRFDVLSGLGATTTATIHSTWVEALVGTGLLGAGLLLGALVVCWKACIRAARADVVTPALLLAGLTVRSLTANAFEAFDVELVLFLSICLMAGTFTRKTTAGG